jgi:hypothetical protein
VKGDLVVGESGGKVFIKSDICRSQKVTRCRDKNLPTSLVGRETAKDASDTALEEITRLEDGIGGQVAAFVDFDNARTEEDAKAADIRFLTKV